MGADPDGRRWRKLPGLQDVTSDLLIANPQINVEIDRDKASALGVTAQQIENALYDAYGERQSSTIYYATSPNTGSFLKSSRNFNSIQTHWRSFTSPVHSPTPTTFRISFP